MSPWITCKVFRSMFWSFVEVFSAVSNFCAWLCGRFVTMKMFSMPAFVYFLMCLLMMSPVMPPSLSFVIGVVGSVCVLHSIPILKSGI